MPFQADYPAPPRAPAGGWKNDAHWIGNVQAWAEDMMQRGFGLGDFAKIYQNEIGEPFPKNLRNTILGNNWLFPGQNALYEYDLDNQRRRSMPHRNRDYPEGTGYGEWEDMMQGERDSASQYYNWRNNSGNEWMINEMGGNPYQAWRAQWGQRFKREDWKPGVAENQFPTINPFTGKPYDSELKPNQGNGPLAPPPAPVTPSPLPPNPDTPLNQESASGRPGEEFKGMGGGGGAPQSTVSRVPGLFTPAGGAMIPGLGRRKKVA